MPTIFEAFKRVITGRPVFDQDDHEKSENHNSMDNVPDVQKTPRVSPLRPGEKYRPQISISDVDCKENGQRMDCYLRIRNDSNVRVELDKIKILGIVQELDTHLRPGEERQFVVRLGNRPQNTQNNKCEVYFVDPSGDYFSAIHAIEYRKLPDNTYEIYRFRLIQPIKDI